MIHPFTTKQLRRPANPGLKTDPTDLEAMKRAIIGGYGKDEQELPALLVQWRLVNRAREDFVSKRSSMKIQCQEMIEAMMPGYCGVVSNIWDAGGALAVALTFGSADALLGYEPEAIRQKIRKQGITMRRSTVDRILAWAAQAATPDAGLKVNRKVLRDYVSIMQQLSRRIARYEIELMRYLVQTPLVAILAIPGVNVVCVSGYGSELGAPDHYLSPKHVMGRAGLFPSRRQSDRKDRPDGPLVRGHNARLRDAIMEVARCLAANNPHFRGWSQLRLKAGRSKTAVDVALADRFVRISYAMMAGAPHNDHPCLRQRHGVLCKLIRFGIDHRVASSTIGRLAREAIGQLPDDSLLYELKELEDNRWYKGRASAPRCAALRETLGIARITEQLWTAIHQSQGDVPEKTAN